MADDPRIRMQAEHLHGAAAVLMGDQGEHLISGRRGVAREQFVAIPRAPQASSYLLSYDSKSGIWRSPTDFIIVLTPLTP